MTLIAGPSPASEPETQAIINLVNAHQFVTYQSTHTFSNLTLYPWGYTSAPTPDDALFDLIGAEMTRYNNYEPGQPPNILYTVSGGSFDWAYGAQSDHPKIYAFSNEIGGNGDGFWPAESRRGPLFQENIWPNLYLLRVAGPFVAVDTPVLVDGDGGTLDPGEDGTLSFLVTNASVGSALQDLPIAIATDDPYVQIGAAGRTVAYLAPMGSYDLAADPIPVTVDPTCPDGHVVTFEVTVAFDGTELTFPLGALVGSPTVVFSDDFESGSQSWQLDSPWGVVTNYSHSPTHALHDSPGGQYADLITIEATLNQSYLASRLVFWHRYDIESGYDYGNVQISTNGSSWTTLESYSGTQSSFAQVDLDLSAYAGQPVRLRFQLDTDYSVTRDGWYVDDVVLYGGGSENEAPAAPTALSPVGGATVGATPALTVANTTDPDGSDALTYGFRVYADAQLTDPVATVDGILESETGETAWTTPALAAGTYWWRAYAADTVERGPLGSPESFVVETSTAVDGVIVGGPRLAVLGSVSGGHSQLQLSLPASGQASVDVYDARGARVRELHHGPLAAGTRVLVWDGRDETGRAVASGVYFVRARVGAETLTGRVMLVR